MTSGGNNFNHFAENQLTKFSARDAGDFRNAAGEWEMTPKCGSLPRDADLVMRDAIGTHLIIAFRAWSLGDYDTPLIYSVGQKMERLPYRIDILYSLNKQHTCKYRCRSDTVILPKKFGSVTIFSVRLNFTKY